MPGGFLAFLFHAARIPLLNLIGSLPALSYMPPQVMRPHLLGVRRVGVFLPSTRSWGVFVVSRVMMPDWRQRDRSSWFDRGLAGPGGC